MSYDTQKTDVVQLDYPINQELLERATHAKEEWRILRDRLSKIEEYHEQVSKSVHDRVRADYEGRVKRSSDALLSEKKEIEHELSTLHNTKKKLEGELQSHKTQLEELKLRNMLGEYNEDDYQKLARAEQEKIGKFETILGAIDNNIERYESIFADVEELFPIKKHETATATPIAHKPEVHEPQHNRSEPTSDELKEPLGVDLEIPGFSEAASAEGHSTADEPHTDDAGYVIEDAQNNYFGGEAEDDPTHPKIDTVSESTNPSHDTSAVTAKLTVIKGSHVGTSFPIKGVLSIGRAESSTVVLKDAKVSRQHAQIKQQGREYIIIDLNSSNGSFVNGEKIDEHVLTNGDEIKIGDIVMQFQG